MTRDVTRESKWDPVYEGPFTVIGQSRYGAYILQDADGTMLPRHYAINQLKIFDSILSGGRSSSKFSKNPVESNDIKDHFVVQTILDHKADRSKKESYLYLVKWKNFDDSNNSWVHERDFDGIAIKKYWKAKMKKNHARPQDLATNNKIQT